MLVLLAILFVVLIVLGVRARKNGKLRAPAAAVAVLAGGLAVYYVKTSAPEPHLPIDTPPEEALGFVLAQRVMEDFPEGGRVIVFQPETDEPRLLKIFTARMDGIQRAAGGALEIVSRGPLLRAGSLEDRQAWLQMEMGFPLETFQRWASEDGDAVAAISLVGLPVGRLDGNTGLPPLYVVELRGVAWDPERLPEGIASIVTYRTDRELDQAKTKELLTVFERNFAMYPAPEHAEEGNAPVTR